VKSGAGKLFHTYILGLPAQFRGGSLEDQLQKYEIDFSRIAAIDPSQLKMLGIKWVSVSPFLSIIPPLTPGEICCSFGHKMIYSEILEGSYDWALILEDDAILRANPKLVNIAELDSSIPTIVQLSPDPTKLEISSSDTLESFVPDPQIVQLGSPQLESCAYFINKEAARRVLDSVPPSLITSRADWPLETSNRVRFMSTSVFCAYQIKTNGNSQIGDRGELTLRTPLILRVTRGVLRVMGITSLAYKVQGAPFFASYRVEVTNPLLRKLGYKKC
jgi:GR25 family glycosyltransferase involved in LPS biosynthesis